MKRIIEIINGISALSYLLIFILGRFYNINPNLWTSTLGIILLCQGYLGFCRYKETRNKIELIIPILTIFFIAATTIVLIF